MAQARQTAKNTFEGGLVMDFSPTTTSDKVLSNALNATLLTFNGNELSLQNDMGNARVESAYLPEGYVPVGTCEFGDIIYIVSYNPLINKSLIGCFPSPERNISNKEVSSISQKINASEFVNIDDDKNNSGEIKASSIKKVIFQNSNLNPGDKFLISWGESGKSNFNYISNYGNTSRDINSVENYWPKLLKVHIVSIEDNGKVTYLDNSVQWYANKVEREEANTDGSEKTVEVAADFVVSSADLSGTDTLSNVDTYRHALECNYSVFQSKIPGKLALFLELETINNFSCGHKTVKTKDNKYDVYLSASWETDNYNVNPCGMLTTKIDYDDKVLTVEGEEFKVDSSKPEDMYNCGRMIEFSRIYKQENCIENSYDYKLFLENSYYKPGNVEKKYLKVGGEESKTLLLTYTSNNGVKDYKIVEENSQSMGEYVINPAQATVSMDGNTTKRTYYTSKGEKCEIKNIPDDVVVNSFKHSVLKKVATVTLLNNLSNSSPNTLTYTVCPCMPYGPLENLAITNTINFDKAKTGDVELSTWKYYVNSSSITLNFGFNTYLKEDEEEVVDKVIMEFYDNQGICASYELTNLDSYDAVFTEYIELDLASSNYRMVPYYLPEEQQSFDRNLRNKNLIVHLGENTGLTYKDVKDLSDLSSYLCKLEIKDEESDEVSIEWIPLEEKLKNTESLKDSDSIRTNDAGILYYGRPYLVKIKIFKGTIDDLGIVDPTTHPDPIIIYRWLWTAPVFNDYYVNTRDFDSCQINCNLDFSATFDGTEAKSQKQSTIYCNIGAAPSENEEFHKSLGALVDYLNLLQKPNIDFYGTPGINTSFGNSLFLDKPGIEAVEVGLALDNLRIENTVGDNFKTVYEENDLGELVSLYPTLADLSESYGSYLDGLPTSLLLKLGVVDKLDESGSKTNEEVLKVRKDTVIANFLNARDKNLLPKKYTEKLDNEYKDDSINTGLTKDDNSSGDSNSESGDNLDTKPDDMKTDITEEPKPGIDGGSTTVVAKASSPSRAKVNTPYDDWVEGRGNGIGGTSSTGDFSTLTEFSTANLNDWNLIISGITIDPPSGWTNPNSTAIDELSNPNTLVDLAVGDEYRDLNENVADYIGKEAIYSTKDSYASYKDNFDLKMGIPNIEKSSKTKSVTYFTSNGTKISKSLNFVEIPAVNWNPEKSDDRIKLALSGIKFNKMGAGEIGSKTLGAKFVPFIDTKYDLDLYGLFLDTNYYIHIRNRINIKISIGTDGNLAVTAILYELDGRTSQTIDTTFSSSSVKFDSDEVQELLRPYLSDAFYLIEFSITKTETNKALYLTNGTIDSVNSTFVRGYSSTGDKITDSSYYSIYALGTTAIGEDGKRRLYVLSDVGVPTKESFLKFTFKDTVSNIAEKFDNIESYALALSSMLMQLYRKENSLTEVKKYGNLAKLLDNTEVWKADIIVEQHLKEESSDSGISTFGYDLDDIASGESGNEGNTEENTGNSEEPESSSKLHNTDSYDKNSTSNYFMILPKTFSIEKTEYFGFNLRFYVECILTKALGKEEASNPWKDQISPLNINPIINPSVRCIEFLYDMPYDVTKLEPYYSIWDSCNASIKKNVGLIGTYPAVAPDDESKVYYCEPSSNSLNVYNSSSTFNIVRGVTTLGETNQLVGSLIRTIETASGKTTYTKGYVDVNRNSRLWNSVSNENGAFTVSNFKNASGYYKNYAIYYGNKSSKKDKCVVINDLKKINLFNYCSI